MYLTILTVPFFSGRVKFSQFGLCAIILSLLSPSFQPFIPILILLNSFFLSLILKSSCHSRFYSQASCFVLVYLTLPEAFHLTHVFLCLYAIESPLDTSDSFWQVPYSQIQSPIGHLYVDISPSITKTNILPLFPNLLFLLGFCLHLARFLVVVLDSCLSSQTSFLTDHLIPFIFISHFSNLPLPPSQPAVLVNILILNQWTSLVAQMVKRLPTVQETWV